MWSINANFEKAHAFSFFMEKSVATSYKNRNTFIFCKSDKLMYFCSNVNLKRKKKKKADVVL